MCCYLHFLSAALGLPSFALQVSSIIPDGRTAIKQGGYQIAYWLITVAFAIISGAVTGLILNLPIFENQNTLESTNNDDRDTFDPIMGETSQAPAQVYAPAPTAAVPAAGAAAPAIGTSDVAVSKA